MHESVERLYKAVKQRRGVEGQSAVARLLDESPQTVKNWESRGISKSGAMKAQHEIGCDANWLITGKGSMDAQAAPLSKVKFTGIDPANVNTSQDPREIEYDNLTLVQATGRRVPLISGVQAGMWAEIQDNFYPGEADEWVTPEHSRPQKHAFALRVDSDSMTSQIPGALSFPEGTILIVDPEAEALPGSYVIAKDVVTQKATFKRLMHDAGRWFLRPLNPAYETQEIDDPAIRIIGRVIEYKPPGGKL